MSYAQEMKSMNCISATGRMPMWAAPAAADDGRLRDGGVDHACLAELLGEALGDFERTAVRPHILSQNENAGITLHLLPQPLPQRLEVGDVGHQRLRYQCRGAAGGSANTPPKADSGGGRDSSIQASV